MLGVLILTGIFCTLAGGSSDERRFIDQVNSVRRELSYVIGDISSLIRDVKKINETIWSKNRDNGKTEDEKCKDDDEVGRKFAHGETTIAFATLLQAFESEKRLNRELQLRLAALENSYVDVLTRLESKENRLNKLEDGHSGLQKEILTEKQHRAQVQDDLKKRIKLEENRLSKLEKNHSDLQKELMSEKQLRQKVENDLKKIEDNVSTLYTEVEQNMTVLIEQEDCICQETITDLSRSTVPVIEEKEKEITTIPSFITSSIGVKKSGLYEMSFNSLGLRKSIYCDGDTDGGDWIVTMRRQDGSVDFNRKWNDYKNGFGDAEGEFWIGNDILHELTKSGPRQLRVDMEDFRGNKVFAVYEQFQIGSEADKYQLSVSGYSGTAGDSMNMKGNVHNGMKFSTIDSDNDADRHIHCAEDYPGGWWFYYCFRSLLTGTYSHKSRIPIWQGIIWYTWTEDDKSLKFVEMKIR